MAITIESFDGHDLSSSDYTARLFGSETPMSSEVEMVLTHPITGVPAYARSSIRERTIALHVEIKTSSYGTRQKELAQWFDKSATKNARPRELLALDDGVSVALDCRVVRLIPYDGAPWMFTAVLMVADPRWRSADVQRTTQAVTASPTTWAVTNDGNTPDDAPRWLLQPYTFKLAASAYRYKADSIVANVVARALSNYAVDVTEAWRHDTEVTAGRAQADGDDVRVFVAGVEVHRWNGTNAATTWNQASGTHLWINLDLAPARTARLLTAMTATSPLNGEDVEVYDDDLAGLPEQGAMLWGDEVITWYGKTAHNASGHAALQDIARAQRGTTAAIHAADITGYWVEKRVQVVWGHSAATAPNPPDAEKPMLDLSAAGLTNANHVWVDFADSRYPHRSMQWRRSLASRDDQSNLIRAATGAPAAAMSLEYDADGPGAGAPTRNQWERDFPTGTDGNIAITRVVSDTMALQVITVDAEGNELDGTVANNGLLLGALASAAVNHDPGDVYGIKFYGFNQVVASYPQPLTHTSSANFGTTHGVNAQQFTTGAEPVAVSGVTLWVQDSSVVRTVTALLCSDDGSDVPATATGLASDTATTAGAGAVEKLTFEFATAVTLQPGKKYWLSFIVNVADVAGMFVEAAYSGGKYRAASANLTYRCWNFQLFGYAGRSAASLDRFDANCLADDQDTAQVTALTVPLLSTGVPYVAMGAREDAYYLDATLRNLATGQSLSFSTLMSILQRIEVDAGERTVRNLAECPFAMTLSGNEITDLVRLTNTQGDGLTVPDASVGVWEATTNILTNGGFTTNTTKWFTVGAAVLTRLTSGGKFGAACLEVAIDAASEGVRYHRPSDGAGSAAVVAGNTYTFTFWLKRTAGASTAVLPLITWFDAGGAFVANSIGAAITLTADMVRYTYTAAAPALSAFGVPTLQDDGTGSVVTFLFDDAQFEEQPVATPYVETDGATATRPAARVRFPVHDLFTEEQGWVFFRLRPGWASGTSGVPFGAPHVFRWGDSSNERIFGYYVTATSAWALGRWTAGAGNQASAAEAFVSGTSESVGFRWTPTVVGISENGGAVADTANTTIPTLTATQADVGSEEGTDNWFDGDFLWAVAGKGLPWASDWAALDAYGDTDPDPEQLLRDLSSESLPTALIPFDGSNRFYRLEEPARARGASLAHTVTPSDEDEWMRLEPGANRLAWEETGVLGVTTATLMLDRWA